MARRKERGPSGEIELYWSFEETASGHLEIQEEVRLATDESGCLILTELYQKRYFIRDGGNEHRVNRWSIDGKTLIELIKLHGKPL
jgi:hypothetical protein